MNLNLNVKGPLKPYKSHKNSSAGTIANLDLCLKLCHVQHLNLREFSLWEVIEFDVKEGEGTPALTEATND